MSMDGEKSQRVFRKQPILCPWITSQPYHSSLWAKNRSSNQNDPALANRFLNNPWINRQIARTQDKPVPSIQQSSSQFFYFLRLMQLFPDTHPATLHTVLTLCKNDFFCAVDKLLYAKRCKLLCYKRNLAQKNSLQKNKPELCKKDVPCLAKQSVRRCDGISLNLSINTAMQEKGPIITPVVAGKDSTDKTPMNSSETSTEAIIVINSFPERAEDLSSSITKSHSEEIIGTYLEN